MNQSPIDTLHMKLNNTHRCVSHIWKILALLVWLTVSSFDFSPAIQAFRTFERDFCCWVQYEQQDCNGSRRRQCSVYIVQASAMQKGTVFPQLQPAIQEELLCLPADQYTNVLSANLKIPNTSNIPYLDVVLKNIMTAAQRRVFPRFNICLYSFLCSKLILAYSFEQLLWSKVIFSLLISSGISSQTEFFTAHYVISNHNAKGKSVKAAAANILTDT